MVFSTAIQTTSYFGRASLKTVIIQGNRDTIIHVQNDKNDKNKIHVQKTN